jgi:hypothetical protein
VSDSTAPSRELLRQQQLLRALWRRGSDSQLVPWLQEHGERAAHGLAAYRGNAAAIAERALAAAYPTVQQLLGDQSFAQLARAFWHRVPPQRGDLAQWGESLPDWLAADAQLVSEPYLADVARLDWAVHAIEHAADVASPPPGLQRLGDCDPAQLRLHLRPGLALLRSAWPIVAIWQAHRADASSDRFEPVRRALAEGVQQTALVARDGWRGSVVAIDELSVAAFFEALLRGATLAHALDAAGSAFAFDRWLGDALRRQWLAAIERTADAR